MENKLTLGYFFLKKISETAEVKTSLFLNFFNAPFKFIDSDEAEPVSGRFDRHKLALSYASKNILHCILALR